ncbi:DUF1934 domain-containing protein [Desulfosporosinus metallidurans]|uniref:DUF1934 domain-containing protein n=1 Tax=Desulfosporosinus metallidurans TaxID=1888891 RepID=A0A1Q8R320_9FIRM|nr:DUF1934 domain-containing protein [Desulfosporosinus metallidurans]OLN33967.1 DUF1934 domain-containing protein [Desulfosporosinus metallidurans]
MQKKVTIQVHGNQKYPEGHEDQQEVITEGMLYERDGVFYVLYEESGSESTGFEEVSTFLIIKEGIVTLNRKGAVDLTQEFKTGELNRSIYTTCYGKIWLSVMPHKVECDLTVHGGRISLEYDLFVDDNLVSYNALFLNIKEDLPL